MTEDAVLVLLVAAVWALLALLPSVAPSLGMPGGSLVWGGGAVLFLALAAAIARADRRGRRA